MPRGTEVGLSPSHVVVRWGPSPPPKKKWGTSSPLFGPCLCGQTARWNKMPLTEVGLGPGHVVLDGDPSLPQKGAQQPPSFQPMSIVTKWLEG